MGDEKNPEKDFEKEKKKKIEKEPEKQTKKASDFEVKDLLESKGLLTYTQTAPTLKLGKAE